MKQLLEFLKTTALGGLFVLLPLLLLYLLLAIDGATDPVFCDGTCYGFRCR